RVVRERIERAIAAGDVAVARMDFTGVGCIDYSCADEIVAKLLRGRPAVVVLSGISDAHREAIEPVLAGHGLAALIEGPVGSPSPSVSRCSRVPRRRCSWRAAWARPPSRTSRCCVRAIT